MSPPSRTWPRAVLADRAATESTARAEVTIPSFEDAVAWLRQELRDERDDDVIVSVAFCRHLIGGVARLLAPTVAVRAEGMAGVIDALTSSIGYGYMPTIDRDAWARRFATARDESDGGAF